MLRGTLKRPQTEPLRDFVPDTPYGIPKGLRNARTLGLISGRNDPVYGSLTGTGIYDFGILSIASSHGHPIPIYPARENAR